MEKKYAALIAIDWADKKHDILIEDCKKGTHKTMVLSHNAESIDQWVKQLSKQYSGKLAIVSEQTKGALLNALLKYDCFDIYPVNPATLAKYRKAFTPSGAKDDPTDAAFMLEILKKHSDRLECLRLDSDETRMLQILVEKRRGLVEDKKRLGNRLTSLLKEYYPLVLKLFPTMGRSILCKFIQAYPTLENIKVASEQEIIEFFRSSHSGGTARLQARLELIDTEIPITQDSAIIKTYSLVAQSLAAQILTLIEQIDIFDTEIEKIYQKHQDFKLFDSLPASGSILAPRLVAALGSNRDRFKSVEHLLNSSGISPVLIRSGNQCYVRYRCWCSQFTRQSFHEWAACTIRYSAWARAFYAMQKANGKTHSVAIRALAYKWIRILFKLWKDNKTYDEAIYILALQKRKSPIIKFMAENSF